MVAPLRKYCLEGGYAPDRLERIPPFQSAPTPPTNHWARARFIWRTEGKRAFFHRLLRYIQFRLSNI